MKYITEEGSNSFMAICMTIFTFCFIFLGVQMGFIYHIIGIACLIASLVYWNKVKQDLDVGPSYDRLKAPKFE